MGEIERGGKKAFPFFCPSLVKPGSHIPPIYLRRSRRLQLTKFGDLSQWVPGSSAMDRRRTYSNLREMQIELRMFEPFYP